MGWTEFTDEAMAPVDTKRTCWTCCRNHFREPYITPGTPFVTRRGLFDGEQKCVSLHATEECAPGTPYAIVDPAVDATVADDAVADDAEPDDDSVTVPPETTPLSTTADEDAAEKAAAKAEEEKAAAAGQLTPSQRQRLEHLAVIKDKGDDADRAYAAWCDASATAKELKKVYEGRMGELRTLIRNGSAQTRLDWDGGDDDDSRPDAGPKPAAPPAANEQPAWMREPLSVLKLPESLIAKLAEGAIETLGHLKAFWDAGRVLNDLKGIGAEKAARIADAFDVYAKAHPEVWGDDAPAAAGSDDDDANDPFAGDAPSEDAVSDDDAQEDATPEDDDPFADDPEYAATDAGADD